MTSKSRISALLCALVLLLCSVATYPVAEIGMNDDWSYLKSAQILAQTGHIVYNGWAAPMLGWQLFLGAIFARLFGPSFTAIRASTLLVALATAFLLQRTFVRAGVNSRNATIGTLTVALSPLFLPLALSYMNDIYGLFCIVLCIYACLRALTAESNRTMLAWLAFAALSNALDGNVRQFVWLGVLAMVPCAVWLLRRRPHAVVVGGVAYLVSVIIIYGTLRWYGHQPYSHSTAGSVIPGHFNRHNLNYLAGLCFRTFFSFSLFLLPILFAFIPALSLRSRRIRAMILSGGLLCVAGGFVLQHKQIFNTLFVPVGNYILLQGGFADIALFSNSRAAWLVRDIRLAVFAAVMLALACFLTCLLTSRRSSTALPQAAQPVSWHSLLVLLAPFALAYLGMLLLRGAFVGVYDRHLLLLLPIGALFLLRFFQDRVQPDLPRASLILVGLLALYAVAGTHDAFSAYRARIAAIGELRAAGIPDNAIDAGMEHDLMVHIERFGHVDNPEISAPVPIQFAALPENCKPMSAGLAPEMVPGYKLSFDPEACGGPSRFAPVTYRGWLGMYSSTLYIDDTEKLVLTQR
jgi:hypothetical protein